LALLAHVDEVAADVVLRLEERRDDECGGAALR
jgi:hypothetical protein